TQYEANVFFYHPDHLGSTSLVTNLDGEVTQHVAYIPYGEVFIEERNGSWNTPYLFNAKELDEETGLYYYGARYLNPKDTRWLSVDPMFEKYVGMTPYNYCAGNPVKLADPTGMYPTQEDAQNALISNTGIKYGRVIQCAENEWCIQETDKDGFPTGYYLRGANDYIEVTSGTTNGKLQYEAWAKRDPSLLQNGGRVSPAKHHSHLEGPGSAADFVSGFSTLINPLLSASNDIRILTTGKDLFENDCSSTGDKILAGADLLTLGLTKGTKAAYSVAREKLVKLGNLEKLKDFDKLYTSKIGEGWYTYDYTMYGKNLIWDLGNKITTSVGSIMTAFSSDKDNKEINGEGKKK
ncbi:MAG: RHS repeat-associated core domain-containing protein, partial [Paludibacteraceae bacterium]|nr:RHS repeat-associated core domain-containing protein [Paludibacteraceae bacterium]